MRNLISQQLNTTKIHFRLLGRDAEYRGNQGQLKEHTSRQKQIGKQKQKQANFFFSQVYYKNWAFCQNQSTIHN